MKRTISRMGKPLLFAALGAGGGYLFYRFFGCAGGCAITSSPLLTMLTGALIGLLLLLSGAEKGA